VRDVSEAVREWRAVDTNTAYIERGSPWENGDIESFNARHRDELLDGEIFYSLREAQRRRHYNRIRLHAPEVFVPALAAWPAAVRRMAPPATLAPKPTLTNIPTGPLSGGRSSRAVATWWRHRNVKR
jgi:putative transposase